tara:strand:+ start:637 stop:1740 length:1104 start_codon:yes stop_codon:yes gene_type:complete
MSFTENNKYHTEHLYGLRAFCALIVALYHYKMISTSPVTDNLFIENGYRFVDVFFSLSGFILYFKYSEINKNIKSIYSFLKKRFLRLYPLHLLILFLFFLIEIAKLYFEQNYDLYGNTHAFELLNIKSFFLKLLMLEGFWGNINATLALNPVSWSISIEFFCYILMIFIIVCVKNKFHNLIFILITFSCLSLLIFKKSFFEIGNYMCLVRGIYSFFLPIIIFILFKKIEFKNNNFISYIIFFSFLYLINVNSISSYILCPILLGFFINVTLNVKEKSHLIKLLNLDFLKFLGKISYGIYMFHVLIWWSISQFFRFILKYDTKLILSKDIKIIDLTPLESNIILLLGLLILISISSLSYYFFEKKFYK